MSTNTEPEDELRPEYTAADFKTLTRGKYATAAAAGTNVVLLDADVAKVFHDDKAVNNALRGLIELARASTHS